ncbi:branched-chain amino acid ABC transporter substrate-binding protein [Bartonella sp. HY329]|uniref:branched-chain amino acid ABC transporter substrate-binding protein n=1 Tax=unclassified Bartonella TaxID=2645622 RepID=UPI0021CA6443|nr:MULTISPECIES: branched-chain amino acid ABC transporter substrate-binding protein [unclassified Bartonella]UXM94079.1 branched-chain amino acid ABC transporter substrate-binding protein [Bartonella sp. HY329]UXN08401.1 branched-chain amino acid ABC transporter substrate-binding protein [Bartonella sp. HY328]
MRLSMKSIFSAALLSSCFFATNASADITIGFIGPVTGSVAAYGVQASNGTRIAIDEINKNGGVNGEKLVLKIFDDAAEPKQGISVANQIAGEGILYVVGPVTSNSAMPVSTILQNNDILMVTPSSTTPELSARNMWNVFRTIGRDDQQADFAAQYALAHWKGKNIAIIHDKATYGKGLADAFKKTLNDGGEKEAYYGSITPGERDYNVIVSRLKSDNIDYVYFGGYHPEAGLLLRQMREQGVKAIMIGGDGLNTSELGTIAGDAVEGTIFTNPADSSKNPLAKEALEALSANNIPAEAFTMNGYAAVQVIAFGIEKAGSPDDAQAVAEVLHSGEKIPTAIGEITYGERGDMTSKTFSLYKWESGKIVPVE